MASRDRSTRAATLADDLERVAEPLIALLEGISPELWGEVPGPGVWSVGKDAEHLTEASVYHQWIVRLTTGQAVASRRPPLERNGLTTNLVPREAADLLRSRTGDSVELIRALTDEQLQLPTRPPRGRDQELAETIERVLIGHYRVHHDDVVAKLRAHDPAFRDERVG